ncbi:hypothetical protein DFH07DRAFT_209138 [Mycena maculata]|uniref:Uncharacterized protein n=1 Tax=Mycena maculata TaxID=230809 RepID=A0AAD7KED4_9AGAR|nr:hypothetical protein DFH07DRAFT_209138 [Mycena maculata]
MADARPSASTSTSTLSPSRPLKRRLISAPDLHFFVPAADSFKPRPYTPHHSAPPAQPERVPIRPIVNHALSNLNMDPLPTDPDTVFLHWPLTTFPDQHLYPEGVTYTALAENLNWFLDPEDYIYENCKNPNAIPYPAALEPPRGWCPARKKDLKDKGPEGWPDGEQPRLRCTFCRRTYAGVNAKSMWRRHVFEKHKIAMANRRNDLERPRGRNSNKENKRACKTIKKEGSHDTIVDLDDTTTAPGAPLIPQGEFAPQLDIAIRPPASPTSSRVIPPASPYDPLLTPSFRHSPPRLPSDQPWRFPSPSHPMHRSRELSLTMLGGASPVRDSPIPARSRRRANTTPLSSPCTSIMGFETPESLGQFPRTFFSVGGTAPLASTPRSPSRRHARISSDVSDDWNASSLTSDRNPFVAILGVDGDDGGGSPPSSSPEGESPVVRSAARPTGVGLGIGLLEPFILPDSCFDADADAVDLDELMHLDDEDEAEVLEVLVCSQEDPPLKKRRVEGS